MIWERFSKYLLIWLVIWIGVIGFTVISNAEIILGSIVGSLEEIFWSILLIAILIGGIVMMLRAVFR